MIPPSDSGKVPEPLVAIEKGHAREALSIAFANVARAMGELEATADAIARALDQTATPRT